FRVAAGGRMHRRIGHEGLHQRQKAEFEIHRKLRRGYQVRPCVPTAGKRLNLDFWPQIDGVSRFLIGDSGHVEILSITDGQISTDRSHSASTVACGAASSVM